MGKFTIQPHGRLQEWIAHEKGYFREEGLDYEFARGPSSDTRKNVDARGNVTELLSGAFESYKHAGGNKGVKSDISCACHWAVNQASSQKVGTMWGKSYVVTPGGIMVPPESPIDDRSSLPDRKSPSAITQAAISLLFNHLSRSSREIRSSSSSAVRFGPG